MLENPDRSFLSRLDKTLRGACGAAWQSPDADAPLVVGVSGGPDSVCLLHSLQQLNAPVVVAHLDHALRPESATEAETVRSQAGAWGAVVVVAREDAAAAAQAQRLSLEEAARELRYRFLFRVAHAYGAQAVAVAHTADDQVETFLMHLLRGAGPAGLGGMPYRSLPNPWDASIPLIRPLLDTWRVEIDAYLQRNRLASLTDSSNQDWRFYRNRLRGEALPYLESLNPGVRARFHQTAELLRDEDEALEDAAAAAWKTCLAHENPARLALDGLGLRTLPLALQRRLLRKAAARLRPGLRDIDFAAIQRAIAFLHTPPRSRQADWIAGLRLEMDDGHLWIIDGKAPASGAPWPQLHSHSRLKISIPGEVDLPDGWRLQVSVHALTDELRNDIFANPDPYQAWLDRASLPEWLAIRPRLPGDRFRPLGMEGHSVKLSDFMINNGLPRRARAAWPLVVAEDEIAWVPGYRTGEAFAVRDNTTATVRLALKHDAHVPKAAGD